MLGHSEYKISFMLDHSAMLTVNTEKYGEHGAACMAVHPCRRCTRAGGAPLQWC